MEKLVVISRVNLRHRVDIRIPSRFRLRLDVDV